MALSQVLTAGGLLLDITGAGILTWDLIVTPAQAKERAATFFNGNPHLAAAIFQSARKAKIAGCLIVAGFFAQLMGAIYL